MQHLHVPRSDGQPPAVQISCPVNLSFKIREGAAVIPVVGPLFRYANIFTAISGASSYEVLAKDFTSALENPDVHSIILDIDSPGGEVNGNTVAKSSIRDCSRDFPSLLLGSNRL
jgi:ClpP class serine protease